MTDPHQPIIPNKLVPPPDALERIKSIKTTTKPGNPIIAVIKQFFGEGF